MHYEDFLSTEDYLLFKILKQLPQGEMTNIEKLRAIMNLFDDFVDGKVGAEQELFDFIANISTGNFRRGIIDNLKRRLNTNESLVDKFEKEAILRSNSREELYQCLLNNIGIDSKYTMDVIGAILPTLSKTEVVALLSTYHMTDNQRQMKQYILDNYDGTYDAKTYFCLDSKMDIFDKLSYEEKIKVAEHLPYMYERIKELKPEDKLYLEGKLLSNELTPLTKETVIKFFNKYPNDRIIEFRGLNILEYLQIEEMKEMLPLYEQDSLVYRVLDSAIVNREFSQLTDEEKRKVLLNSDLETLEKHTDYSIVIFELLSDEELLEKIRGKVIHSQFMAHALAKRFNAIQLKDNDVKFTALTALKDLSLLEKDENLTETEKKLLANALCSKARKNKEYKNKLIKMLKEDKNLIVLGLDMDLEFNDILEIAPSNPSVLKHLLFSKYNEEKLLALKEYASENKEYIQRVLSICDYNGNMNDEFSKAQLDMLSHINQEDYYTVHRYPIFSNYGVINDLVTIGDKTKLLTFLKLSTMVYNNGVCKYIQENNLENSILSIVDPSGDLVQLYKTITDNTTKLKENRIDPQFALAKFWANLDHVYKNKETLLKMQSSNKFVMSTINYKFLEVLTGDKLEYFARYKELDTGFTFKNGAPELIAKIADRLHEVSDYSDSIFEKCLTEISRKNDEELAQLLTQDIDTVIYLMNNNPRLLSNDISDFAIEEKEVCDRIMETSTDLNQCLDTFFREKCKMNLENARRLVRIYGHDLEELKAIYADDKKLSKAINMLASFKKILNTKNIDTVKDLYKNNKPVDSFLFPFVLEENLKTAYNRELAQDLYKVKDTDRIEDNVYEVKDNFKMIVTVIGAYVKNKDALDNPKSDWNDDEKVVNHGICSSFITNNNLAMAYNPNKLIYGFDTLEDTAIVKSANYDIFSISDNVEIKAYKEDKFMLSKSLTDNVRLGHSEQVIERRIAQTNLRRQPSYIVAIDEVKVKDKKAAKDFGIPIVLIKSENIAKQESKKLLEAFKDTKASPTCEKIRRLVIEYHNNYAGLQSVNPEAGKKYFNPKMVEKYFIDLAQSLHSLKDQGKKEELLNAYMEALCEEEKKRDNVSFRYIPFDFKSIKYNIKNNNKAKEHTGVFAKLKSLFNKR